MDKLTETINALKEGLDFKLYDNTCVLLTVKTVSNALELLKEKQPKIVRCKDCKYFQEGTDINGEHFNRCNCEKRTPTMTWGARVTPDWFCGHAEAKDGEQDAVN